MRSLFKIATFCGLLLATINQPAHAENVVIGEIGGAPLLADFRPVAEMPTDPRQRLSAIRQESQNFALLQDQIARRLPSLLGKTCDVAIAEADLSAFEYWWNTLIQLEIARLEKSGQPFEANVRAPALRAVKPIDMNDEKLRVVAVAQIERAKRAACIAAAFPADPLGLKGGGIPVTPPAYNEQFIQARYSGDMKALRVEGVPEPKRECLSIEPIGATWDMFKEAESRGVLKITDAVFAPRLSTAQRARPQQPMFRSCFNPPPWLSASANSVMFELGGKAHTLGEFVESRPTHADLKPVAIQKARLMMLQTLPSALGKVCDLKATEIEISAYARWWDMQIGLEADRYAAQEAVRPSNSQPYSESLRAIPKHDPKDPRVRNYAISRIETAKAYACAAAAYPEVSAAEPAPAPTAVTSFAYPLREANETIIVPIDTCATYPPAASQWDMFKHAEDRGLIKFVDNDFRSALSSAKVERMARSRFMPQTCFAEPPWMKKN